VAFLSDTGAADRRRLRPAAAAAGVRACTARGRRPGPPTVGVVFYRAHELSGNAGFVDVLCDALEDAGANARPVYVGSLRRTARAGCRSSTSCCPTSTRSW
jgi:cobaltochelatase CobN